jgi:hypothetical protein
MKDNSPMRFRVTFEGRLVSGASATVNDEARAQLANTMAELNQLGSAAGNAAINVAASTGQLKITCAVAAETPEEAVQIASDNMYLSLNKAGIGTPKWPSTDAACWNVRFIRSSAEELVPA